MATDYDPAKTSKKSAVPKDAIKSAVDDAKSTVTEAASTAQEAIGDVASEAQRIAAEAGEKAKAFAEENKGRAAQQLDGIYSAITAAADELDAKGQSPIAKYTRDLAGGLQTLSKNLNEKGVDELMASVGQFARSQPAAFLGAAALLGFVSSRFALSTAHRPAQQQSGASSARNEDWTSATGADEDWESSEGDLGYESGSSTSRNGLSANGSYTGGN